MRNLVVLVILLSIAAWVYAQEPFVVTLDVDLITLDVGVSDASGRPLLSLTRDDFEIYEDGKVQEIRSFASVETAYSVLMLFDCSGSTQPSWPFLVEAMNRFTGSLRPQDGIAVAQFGSGFKKLLDWTPRSGKGFEITIEPADKTCSGTDFYGALDRALDEFRGVKGRKGALVLTDGQDQEIPVQRRTNARFVDSAEDREFQKLLRTIQSGGVAFYFIAVDTDLNPALPTSDRGYNPARIYNMQQQRSRLQQLAEASGGRVGFPQKPQDVIPLYAQIGAELGSSYGLGYTSANKTKDGKYRRIEVRVRDKSLKVRQSREGYEAK